MREEQPLIRPKTQLQIVGVVCVTVVILTLWIVNLRTTLRQAQKNAADLPIKEFQQTRAQLGPQWDEFQKNLQELKK